MRRGYDKLAVHSGFNPGGMIARIAASFPNPPSPGTEDLHTARARTGADSGHWDQSAARSDQLSGSSRPSLINKCVLLVNDSRHT
jgi:hypothetical protein